MIVVDTNVVAYFWLPGEHTAMAERLRTADPEWTAPLLWRSELRSVLVGWMRRGHLDMPTAAEIAAAAEAQMAGREFAVSSARVLERAAASGCSAYDCEFVVLAEELDVALVTTDRQVLSAFPDLAKTPERYLSA